MPFSNFRAAEVVPVALALCLASVAHASSFTQTGDMVVPRSAHTATLMTDGRVLIAGGTKPSVQRSGGPIVRAFTPEAEIYDPATGQFTATDDMTVPRVDHAAAALADGRVLVVGGYGNDETQSNGEIYDPLTGTFSAIASDIPVGGERATATALDDGRVLIIGGFNMGPLAGAQIFDPSSDTFTATGALNIGRFVHTATRLADGRVLVVGGLGGNEVRDDAEIYDPATGTFTLLTATMSVSRERHAASLLPDGRVLIAGGYTVGDQLNTAELFDPATETFSPAANTMAIQRVDYRLRTLIDGQVLVIGSQRFDLTESTAELFSPLTDSFVSIPGPATERGSLDATVLDDGRVLLSGGSNLLDVKAGPVPYGEIYTPAALDIVFANGFDDA